MRIVKDAAERKNEILDVAEELFTQKGFDDTSTNDIINVIGIARGTLYHHFKSKEEILDAVIERLEGQLLTTAKTIATDKSIPVLQRFTMTIMALNVDTTLGQEVIKQVHRPQNALLHQKMQNRLIAEVVPIVGNLISEGVSLGIFNTKHPIEAAEMVMIYSNVAFDDMMELTEEEIMGKVQAFIYHTERVLGAKQGILVEVIMPIFLKEINK
ncbi:MAG: TetR/AcrR family transcriptional regulator [Lachnospiraceae bacterium]|nr:TetR/AcrR family transcriptional regulator [Candidatus Colinaster equi]